MPPGTALSSCIVCGNQLFDATAIVCRHCGYCPTEETIAQRAAEIRATWSAATEQLRIAGDSDKVQHAELETYHITWGKR